MHLMKDFMYNLAKQFWSRMKCDYLTFLLARLQDVNSICLTPCLHQMRAVRNDVTKANRAYFNQSVMLSTLDGT